MKTSPTSLVNRERQIKTTMTYYFISNKMAKKKEEMVACVDRDTE